MQNWSAAGTTNAAPTCNSIDECFNGWVIDWYTGGSAALNTRLSSRSSALSRAGPRMGDRYNITGQWEHLQAKHVGTGHPDIIKFEWAVNIHRDSNASYLGHYPLLSYFAVAEGESIARVRYNILERMLQPCGPPPAKEDD